MSLREHEQDVPYRYAVLLASRGRPWNLARLHSTIQDTAARPDLVDIWLYVDEDDPEGLTEYLGTEVPIFRAIEGPRILLAASWNFLAEQANRAERYTHFLAWGDDVIPETPGWDKLFAEASWQHGAGWYYGRDGIWDDRPWDEHPEHLCLPTHTAISVEAYRAVGFISPPGIKHLCIDLVWRDLAMAAGALFYLPEIMIRHLHPMVTGATDQTYHERGSQDEKNADARAYKNYVYSPRFQRDVQKVGQMRDEMARARKRERDA